MIRKRAIAAVLTILMLVTLFPMDVWAYVGTKTTQTKKQVRTGSFAIKYGSGSYRDMYLENDYIRLDLVHLGDYVAVITQPKRTAESADKLLESNNYAVDSFSAQFGEWGGEGMLKAKEISMKCNDDNIVLDYTFTDSRAKISVTYTLANLNEGYTDDHSNEGYVNSTGDYSSTVSIPDDNAEDGGRAWGIMADMGCKLTGNASGGAYFRWYRDYNNFNAMGHRTVFSPGTVKMSKTTESTTGYDYRKPYTFNTQSVDITGGVGRTDTCTKEDNGYYGNNKTHYITEVFMDSYFWANPFVTTGVDFYSMTHIQGPSAESYDGVNGFDSDRNMPQYVTYYTNGNLRVQSAPKWLYRGDARYDNMPSMLVGFRNLYKKNEDNFTPSDKVTVAADSNRLGVFKTEKSYSVYLLDGGQGEKKLENTYGKPVAVYKGKFQQKTDSKGKVYYEFANQVAALSDTVTASWNKDKVSGKQPHFYVYQEGTVDMYMIRLNTPKFKFYEPKDNSLKLVYNKNGIEFTMDPEKNKAVIYTDIPNTTSSVDRAVVGTDGSLVFKGEVSFDVLFGKDNELTMTKLGYGMSNGEFKVNGVAASGKIDTANMIGIELAKIEGEINTFKKEERYAFSVEVNAFDLFEGEAELELKRLKKTGDLVPNKLYVAGYAEPGIPLIPPIVVARLTGGGGGFDGLADTINGDFLAIPPLTLSMEGGMSYLHVFNGKAKTTIGPSKVQVELKDVNVCKLPDLITSLEWHLGVTGQQKVYNNKTYTGLNGNGGMSIEMNVPKDMEVFQVTGAIDLNGFAGADNYKRPTSIYMDVNVVGDVSGKVKVPKKWKLIGGKTVASAKVDFALGARTAISVRNVSYQQAVKSAFDNLSFHGGLAYTGHVGKIYCRIYYIIPSTVGGKVSWGEPDEWDVEEVAGLASVPLYDEDGNVAGMGYMELYMDEAEFEASDAVNILAATATDADDEASLAGAAVTSTFELTDMDSVRSDAAVLLTLEPGDGISAQELADGLHLYDENGDPVELRWMPDVVDEQTDDMTNYNAVIGTGAGSKDTVFVSLGTKQDCAGKYSWKVVSDAGSFTGKLYTQNPEPTIAGSATYRGTGEVVVNTHVDSPVANEKYVLSTYLGSEYGSADYLIDSREITDIDTAINIPCSGTMMPTGSYYITTYLEQEREGDFDGDGTVETASIPVDSATYGQPISYTNEMQPDAPTNVEIKSTGNEVMNAKWKSVPGADGYKINIYTVDAAGNVQDTARSYDIAADDIDSMTGISYNAPSNEYSMDMALTVGGSDLDGNSMALDADMTYRIGVQAYKNLTTDENDEGTAPIYSTETFSQDEVLPAYRELNLSIRSKNDSFAEYQDVTADEDTGIYYVQTNKNGYASLSISAEDAGGAQIEYTLTRMDNGDEILGAGSGEFDIPSDSFTGTQMLKIAARNVSTGDVTSRYITLQRDETAPILTLDKSSVTANASTGKFTITGYTEPGAEVVMDATGTKVNAGDDGRFSLTGKLARVQVWDDDTSSMVDTDEFEPLLTDIYARDSVGNQSASVAVVASVKTAVVTGGTVRYELQGGSWKSGYTAPVVYSSDNVITFPAADKITRKGYTFGGWYDNAKCKGTPVSETTSTQSGAIVLYAKWEEKGGKATTETPDTEHPTSVTTADTTEITTVSTADTTEITTVSTADTTEMTTGASDGSTSDTTSTVDGNDSPGTGDPAVPVVWMILCVVCISGAVVLYGRKRGDN